MLHCRPITLTVALLLFAPFAARSAGWIQAPTGVSGWRALTAERQTCVSDRAGDREICWPDNAGEITDLREVVGGWIAAGQEPAASGRDLFIVRNRGDGLESLPPPPDAGIQRGRPQLVTDDSQLLGLIWLEGESQRELVVRSAEWHGEGWGTSFTVSPVGPGGQLAPTTTVLDDGRWLLLWTAFDGNDDETTWSVFDGERWSPRARLHEDNATPDIVPTVLATADGAIAAWSWLDGRDYRVRTAFFDGAGWRLDPPLAGRGAVEPQLTSLANTHLLCFQTVVPEAWVAIELDGRGRVLHRGAVPSGRMDRPAVDFAGNGVAFRWLDGAEAIEAVAVWETVP